MSRPPRPFSPNGHVLITQKSLGGLAIFRDRRDFEHFLAALETVVERHGFQTLDYVLLPDEIRLLLKPGQANLSAALHGLFTSAAKFFCQKYGWTGHVFASRYHAEPIPKSRLRLTAAALTRAPVRAGLVATAAAWPFCSCSGQPVVPNGIIAQR